MRLMLVIINMFTNLIQRQYLGYIQLLILEVRDLT